MGISVKVSGSKFKIESLAKKVQDSSLARPLSEATVYLERQTKIRFTQGIDPDNKPWTPNKPSTLARKSSTAILIDKAILVNSITSSSYGLTGKVFTPTDYGIYAQLGTKFMEPRRFLGINNKDTEGVKKIFNRYLGV